MFALIHKHKRLAAVIIAVASLSFLFWMFSVSDLKQMFGLQRCVATVNGSCITLREYRYELLRFSSVLNNPELKSLIKRQVLNSVISREVLFQKALGLGIVASDREVAETVKEDPAFRKDGAFSFDTYKDFLERIGLTPTEYEEILRKALTVRKLFNLVESGSYLSKVELDVQKKLTSAVFKGRLYLITPEYVKLDYRPTSREIEDFFAKNRDKFKVKKPAVYRVWKTDSKEEAYNVYSLLKSGSVPKGGTLYRGEKLKTLPEEVISTIERLSASERFLITKSKGTYYIAYLEELPSEKVKKLEEVKDQIIKMLIESKKEKKLKEEAIKLKAKLSAGRKVGLRAVEFDESRLEEFISLFHLNEHEALRLVFSKERVFGPYKVHGGFALVYVEKKLYGEVKEEELKRLRESLLRSKADSLLGLLADKLVKSASIKINEDYLR